MCKAQTVLEKQWLTTEFCIYNICNKFMELEFKESKQSNGNSLKNKLIKSKVKKNGEHSAALIETYAPGSTTRCMS